MKSSRLQSRRLSQILREELERLHAGRSPVPVGHSLQSSAEVAKLTNCPPLLKTTAQILDEVSKELGSTLPEDRSVDLGEHCV